MDVIDVVDGMNVIGTRPTGWWRDRDGAVRALYGELVARRRPVVLVLDGKPVEGVPAADTTVVVLYADRSGRNAADDKIVEVLAAADAPTRFRVITSDRDLRARVEALGAATGSPRQFLENLRQ